jgi:hypothetical protein
MPRSAEDSFALYESIRLAVRKNQRRALQWGPLAIELRKQPLNPAAIREGAAAKNAVLDEARLKQQIGLIITHATLHQARDLWIAAQCNATLEKPFIDADTAMREDIGIIRAMVDPHLRGMRPPIRLEEYVNPFLKLDNLVQATYRQLRVSLAGLSLV